MKMKKNLLLMRVFSLCVLLGFMTLTPLAWSQSSFPFDRTSPSGHTITYEVIRDAACMSTQTVKVTNIGGPWTTGDVVLPDSVTTDSYPGYAGETMPVVSIDANACDEVAGITSIVIPSTVTGIGNNAFKNATNLRRVQLPNSLTSLGVYAFEHTAIDSVTIPGGITKLPSGLFFDCDRLRYVSLPQGLDTIMDAFCWCDSLADIDIPDGVRYINSAFWGTALVNVGLPDSLSYIDDAFENCHSLTSVTFANHPVVIGNGTFMQCNALTTVHLGDSVLSIGQGAFYECTALREIEIPATVTSFGLSCFRFCDSLERMVMLGEVPPTLHTNMFFHPVCVPQTALIEIPCGSLAAYTSAWGNGFTFHENTLHMTVGVADMATGHVEILTPLGCDSTAVIMAVPNLGYAFDHWSDGDTTNPRTVTLTTDSTFIAYFNGGVPVYSVTVSPNDSQMGYVTGGGSFNAGSVTTISAEAFYGFKFEQWDDGDTHQVRQLTVDSNLSFTAQFGWDGTTMFSVIAEAVVDNDYNNTTCMVTGGGEYVPGSMATLTAVAGAGYQFAGWWDTEDTNRCRTVRVMFDNLYCAARFYSDSVMLCYLNVSSNDSLMGYTQGSGRFPYGEMCYLVAKAYEGYHFVGWSDGGEGIESNGFDSYRFITITSDTVITALFSPDEEVSYTISVLPSDSLMGTVGGGGTYTDLSTATIEATAFDGYRFVSWNDGDTANPRYIIVTGDSVFTALFEAVQGIDAREADRYNVTVVDGTVYLEGAQGKRVLFYDVQGRLLGTFLGSEQTRVSVPLSGIYFVSVDNRVLKKVLVVR